MGKRQGKKGNTQKSPVTPSTSQREQPPSDNSAQQEPGVQHTHPQLPAASGTVNVRKQQNVPKGQHVRQRQQGKKGSSEKPSALSSGDFGPSISSEIKNKQSTSSQYQQPLAIQQAQQVHLVPPLPQQKVMQPQRKESQQDIHLSVPVTKHRGQQIPKEKQAKSRSSSTIPTAELSKLAITEGRGGAEEIPFIEAKPGIKGRKIIVESNHLQLDLGKLETAIHYDVNIIPDRPKEYFRVVLEEFRKKHYSYTYPAFDGKKNLYSTKLLKFGHFISDLIVIEDKHGRILNFTVEIKFAKEVDLRPLKDLLKFKVTPREALQVVDIVLRSAPVQKCIPFGRSFFFKPVTVNLGEGTEMYHGFYQSAIRGWKPFLNVDVVHKAFIKNISVCEIIIDLFHSNYRPFTVEHLSKQLERKQVDELENFLKNVMVLYEISGIKKIYRVHGFDLPPKENTFLMDNGEKITMEKYYARFRNCKLKYSHLPSLRVSSSKSERKICLPLELCTIKENQVVNRMTENQTRQMIKEAATTTQERKRTIMNALAQTKHNQDRTVKEFGFSIGNDFEVIDARVLDPPKILYADDKIVQPSKGVWRNNTFLNGVAINRWTIVCVNERRTDMRDLVNFAKIISETASLAGMHINVPERPFSCIGGRVKNIEDCFKSQKAKTYDVIFVIIPSENKQQQYSSVKTIAEISVGCLTQCIKQRTLTKMNNTVAANILLKVNSKLNGINHTLGTCPLIMKSPCMIMGADVTHPSPGDMSSPSVAAVTASHDLKFFKFNYCWRLQPPTVEIIEDLEAITHEQLLYFYRQTNRKPEKIVFFRDGVSEGHFAQVRDVEIKAIRAACKRIQAEGFEPSITFLVVQKRHHTRFFPKYPKDSEDRNNNVPAGTCVDTKITHPFMQDFYLVSHASIQGVARPTKYCTLWDDNNLTNDEVQELTYSLCHMFSRCNRSVSYPAPTYYAHLAAARAKVYIKDKNLDMGALKKECMKLQIQEVIQKGHPMFFV